MIVFVVVVFETPYFVVIDLLCHYTDLKNKNSSLQSEYRFHTNLKGDILNSIQKQMPPKIL